jgi:hypothetical protein
MKWSTLNTILSRRRHDELTAGGSFSAAELTTHYESLREKLMNEIPCFGEGIGAGTYDVATGLALYRILGEAGMNVRFAADDGVWRFLSLRVVPDLVVARWPNASAERFWRVRSRIWLRAIWWLIHLSWQGTEEKTRAVLVDATTDTLLQLVDRAGKGGFRVELMRALLRERSRRKFSQDQFRALMKLNTARLTVTEPWFCEGGIAGYARELHDYVANTR